MNIKRGEIYLAALDPVRTGGIEAEAVAPVGQHDAGRSAEAAAEIVEQRVDEAAGVAVAINHRDIDRAVVARWRLLPCAGGARLGQPAPSHGRAARHGVSLVSKMRYEDSLAGVGALASAFLNFLREQ